MNLSSSELFCLLEDFKSQFQFQCLWLVSSHFQFLLVQSRKGCTFLRICPFLPGCPFYWHIIFCGSLLMILCISVVSCNFSFLISNFIDLSPPVFSWWVWLKVCQFCLSFKEPAFSFIDLCYCFLYFYFIYFCSDLHDFFPSTIFSLLLFVYLFFH